MTQSIDERLDALERRMTDLEEKLQGQPASSSEGLHYSFNVPDGYSDDLIIEHINNRDLKTVVTDSALNGRIG